MVGLDDWLNKIIYEDSEINPIVKLSRRDLIFYVRHQDGGSHVDKNLDDVYSEAKSSDNSVFNVNGIIQKLGNSPIHSSLIQIGWEVLNSIK